MNAAATPQPVREADILESFAQAMRAAGLEPPARLNIGGEIKHNRCPEAGHGPKDDAGWYLLHLDGSNPFGVFGNHREGSTHQWSLKDKRDFTQQERDEFKARVAESRKAIAQADRERHDHAAKKAAQVWAASSPMGETDAHPYQSRKGVQPHGARLIDAAALHAMTGNTSPALGKTGPLLVLPIFKGDKLRSLQFINAEGVKRPLTGGEKSGCHIPIGEAKEHAGQAAFIVCEGWATGGTIHEAVGHAVRCAIDAGNMPKVTAALRRKYPEALLIVAADDDVKKPDNNAGSIAATNAAISNGAEMVRPLFGPGRTPAMSDFNDLAQTEGAEAVRKCFAEVFSDVVEVEGVAKADKSQQNQQVDNAADDSCPQTCPQNDGPEPVSVTFSALGESPFSDHGQDVAEIPADPRTDGAAFDLGLIPGESGRPSFVCFDEWYEAPSGERFRPGLWYFATKPQKGDNPPLLTQQWVCTPIHMDAVTTSETDGDYGRLLRFRTVRGGWKTWAMPSELLGGDGSEIKAYLWGEGARIEHGQDWAVLKFLKQDPPNKRIQCATATGWAGDPNGKRRAFVLPTDVIGPGAAGVVFQSTRYENDYTTRGDLDTWRAEVAAMAVGNPLLCLAMCAAFAGPVLRRVNGESGGVHLVGRGSTGKSTAVDVACSVWGGETFKRSWRATANGMEGAAVNFNDGLLALDEVGEADGKAIGGIVYALGNGVGKQRAGRSGRARPVHRWRCSVISSGELTIEGFMLRHGQQVMAGHKVRMLDVEANRKFGLFDTLHHHASGSLMSEAVKQSGLTHYGKPGREFLEHFTRDDADMLEALEAIKALPDLQPGTNEGQATRAARRFAIFGLAGELATQYGVTGWPQGEAIRAAAVGLKSWLSLLGSQHLSGDGMERGQVLTAVAEFLERHGDARFSDVAAHDDDRAAVVRDRAGWWQAQPNGERHYLFTTSGIKAALIDFDFSRATDTLVKAGALPAKDAQGRASRVKRIRGLTARVFEVNPQKLAEAQEGGDHGSR